MVPEVQVLEDSGNAENLAPLPIVPSNGGRSPKRSGKKPSERSQNKIDKMEALLFKSR